jgi:gliding motility-associated-like protein
LAPDEVEGVTEYYLTETENGCVGPSSLIVITISNCEIIIPTAFTPDGDMTNDTWELIDLDTNYPNNVVYVYNRWGNKVFESPPGDYSNNQWLGDFKGEMLPVGSYYFIIEFNNEAKESVNGTISIILDK